MNESSWGVIIITAICVGAWFFHEDDNAKPVYGKEFGLPVNCRAYVQASIDGYRTRQFSADEAFNGLERNCGRHGYAWKDNREK